MNNCFHKKIVLQFNLGLASSVLLTNFEYDKKISTSTPSLPLNDMHVKNIQESDAM